MSKLTADILVEMLTENTGRALCDSGGYPSYNSDGTYTGSQYGYGRNFERNQLRDFEKEQPSIVSFRRGEIDIVHNVYHWLKDRLDYDQELDELFHDEFLKDVDPDNDKTWLTLMEEFPAWLAKYKKEKDDYESYENPGGIYGEGEPMCINTYNGEDLLSQTIQFQYWECDAGEFVALQTHNGCDVRGGYSSPHIFRNNGHSELAMFDNARGTIYCTGENHHPSAEKIKAFQESQLDLPGIESDKIDFAGHREHYWTTDDGHHWYESGCCGKGYCQLEKFDTKDLDDEEEEKPGEWEPGRLCFNDDGVGYCPVCGAKLDVGFY